jgi:hypothetical protein
MLCSGIKPQAVNNQSGRTYAITADSKQAFFGVPKKGCSDSPFSASFFTKERKAGFSPDG